MGDTSSSVLILGATGLVGAECVHNFAESPRFAQVIALARRPLETPASTRVETHVIDFEQLDAAARHFRVSHIVCALGTTIKKAGTQERFRRVDYDYPLAAARLGVREGARHFLLGKRAEVRPGEAIGKLFAGIVPRKWRPVHGSAVAGTLVRAAVEDQPGVRIIESREIGC